MKLRMEGIKKAFGKNEILKSVDFHVEEGKFLSIYGASGSGKSTILKVITGLLEVEDGHVFLDEEEITNLAAEKRGIAYVFQAPHLFPHLNVRQNIAFGLEVKKYAKSEIQKRVNYLVELLRIEELLDRYPNQLSGGQQQRVSIARALASYPSVLLMDEPFSGLDRALRVEMGNLIKSLQSELQLTIVFVTHDLSECLRLSDTIALLEDGNILQLGKAKSVYYQPVSKRVATLMGGGNWIEGVVKDERFICRFMEREAKGQEDGKTALFFRPHQIRISQDKANGTFVIKDIKKLGKEIEVEVEGYGMILTIETFDDSMLVLGKEIRLEFPMEIHF